jgi:GntR family transcriptional regulator/MocR family aminotransferase
LEVLVRLDRQGPASLGSQLQGQLRHAIRSGSLRAGTRLPSTRALAQGLGISRPIVVDAYEQLAAEGYLQTRRGARPTVCALAPSTPQVERATIAPEAGIRFDRRRRGAYVASECHSTSFGTSGSSMSQVWPRAA